jgi:leader peptidase (prepilin peptidase) / N-methyltransferase
LDPFVASVTFVFGLLFGSFLNVCIYRMPRGLSVVWPGSACPNCKTAIQFYDNIPVLSWLILRGRCRHCKALISSRYMLVELLTAGLFLACYAHLGLTLGALKCAVFAFLLLGLIFSDAETKLLPDKLTLPGISIGLIFSLFVPVNDLLMYFLPNAIWLPINAHAEWRFFSLLDALLGAAVGASFIYGVGAIYMRWRGVEGMGFGDVKLMAMIGAFLGVRLTVLTLFAATLAGSFFGIATVLAVWIKRTRRRITRNRESAAIARQRAWQSAQLVYRHYQMPFGVFLGSMALLSFFFGNGFLRWYWGLM